MAKMTFYPGRVEIETPYNPLFVEDIRKLDSRYRKWDQASRTWTVWDPYVKTAIDITLALFPQAEMVGEYQERRRGPFAYGGSSGSWHDTYGAGTEDFTWEYNTDRTRKRRVYTDGTFGQWIPNFGEQGRQGWEWDYDDTNRLRRKMYPGGTYGPWEPDPDAERRDRERSQTRQDGPGAAKTGDPDCRVLFIADDAPLVVLKAAYGALAKLYHPDVTQDPNGPEKMKALNTAYVNLKRKRNF